MKVNTILHGDAWELIKTLPDKSIHMVCTSPPYFGLRDYQTAEWVGGDEECDHIEPKRPDHGTRGGPKSTLDGGQDITPHIKQYENICQKCGATRIDSQFGLEETPEAYVEKLVGLFREVWRVLRDDGVVFLNLGDSYAGQGGPQPAQTKWQVNGGSNTQNAGKSRSTKGLKAKNLYGIPWRVALALQEDGWILRSDIIWTKKNCLPESVRDRCTKAHEYIFLLAKQGKYYFDQEAIREPSTQSTLERDKYTRANYPKDVNDGYVNRTNDKINNGFRDCSSGRNKRTTWTEDNLLEYLLSSLALEQPEYLEQLLNRHSNKADVWDIATRAFSGAHFAVMPEELVKTCILAGTSAKGCCPECKVPYERIKEQVGMVNCGHVKEHHNHKYADEFISNKSSALRTGLKNEYMTVGWQPTCSHNLEPIPCTILDPFMGAGTVAAVAKHLGRSYIGFELNQDYIDMAQRRIDNTDVPLPGLEPGIDVLESRVIAEQLEMWNYET